jgi:hypothetical protein
MNLEIKHLAPYLPYKLKCLYTHTNKIGTISNIYTIGDGYDNEDVKLSIDYNNEEHIWMFKPILRPLSDLTKEIEVNGEKFVPQKKMPYLDFYWLITSVNPQELVMKNNYEDILKLLEWQFDVFGLIENNLAIDINTLK